MNFFNMTEYTSSPTFASMTQFALISRADNTRQVKVGFEDYPEKI